MADCFSNGSPHQLLVHCFLIASLSLSIFDFSSSVAPACSSASHSPSCFAWSAPSAPWLSATKHWSDFLACWNCRLIGMTPPSTTCFHPLAGWFIFSVQFQLLLTRCCCPFSATAATPPLFASIGCGTGCICPSAFALRRAGAASWTHFSSRPYLRPSFFRFLRPWIRVPPLLCGIFRDRIHKDRQHWKLSWYKARWRLASFGYRFARTAGADSIRAWRWARRWQTYAGSFWL